MSPKKPRRRRKKPEPSKALATLKTVGRATGRAAGFLSDKAAAAWHAIDPDVRQHVADLPLLATTMVGSRAQPIEPRPEGAHRLILCLHGLAGHPQNFLPLRTFFRIYGWTRVYSFSYDDSAPLERSAERFVALADEVLRVNALPRDTRFDLVAHSMGGIVARIALLDPAFARRVHRMVTVGAPHQGTLAARFLATPRALDLRPESPLMRRLSVQVPWPGPPTLPPLVAFYSRADILMLPAATATLEGADNREIPGVSHSGYLVWPRALAQVKAALDEA